MSTEAEADAAYQDILRHPEKYYAAADIIWVLMSSALVFLMVPALSLIYSGLSNRSFALTMFRLPMVTAAFVGLQWALWGYIVTFTDSYLPSNWWGGESRAGALKDVVARPVVVGDGPDESVVIPELVFAIYEGMFASFTAAVVCGGTMHRARPRRFIIFISLWSLLVYNPVARWTWSTNGWLRQLGSLDFAGGTPVHIVSGTTVAAFAVFCSIESRGTSISFGSLVAGGIRRAWHRLRRFLNGVWSVVRIALLLCTCGRVTVPESEETPVEAQKVDHHGVGGVNESFPFNTNFVVLGTALLWFGWAGFNGGSALGANLRAASAWTATHVAGCAGGVTGVIWIWIMKGEPQGVAADEEDPDSNAAVNRALAKQAFDRLSVTFFCDGAIAGLVAITPGAGYVPVWSASVFGLVSALIVNFLKREMESFLRHDPLQIFAVHAGGGVVGMVLTALFVDPVTTGLDGHSTIPHPEYRRAQRVGYQVADAASGMAYSFFMTLAILYLIKAVAVIFGSSGWRRAGIYDDSHRLVDEFQPTAQQQWRGYLDPEGLPIVPPPGPTPPRASRSPTDEFQMERLTPKSIGPLSTPPTSATSGHFPHQTWGLVPGHQMPPQAAQGPWPRTTVTTYEMPAHPTHV